MKTQDLNGVRVTFTLIEVPTSRCYSEAYYSLELQYSEWLVVHFSSQHTALSKLPGQRA